LLQSAYSDYQIRPFENLHQLVENTSLVVLWARLKIFIQYSLRFAYRLKRQLLISHCFFPIKKWLTGEADREIKSALRLSHQFLFRCWDLYLVMAFLFGPKMWGRFAGSEAKKKVVRCLPVYGSSTEVKRLIALREDKGELLDGVSFSFWTYTRTPHKVRWPEWWSEYP
jgi:hypothetical protein